MIRTGKNDTSNEEIHIIHMKKAILLLIIGIAGVSLGGFMVTEGAKNIATDLLVTSFGMSETKAITLVGLSIVAIGTSLPEMVTSIVAAKRKKTRLLLVISLDQTFLIFCLF